MIEQLPRQQQASSSGRAAEKAAGLAYIVPTVILLAAEFAIFKPLIGGDPGARPLTPSEVTEAARNVLAHQSLFRLGIALSVTYCVGVVIAASAYYAILRPHGQATALAAAGSRLVFCGLFTLAGTNYLTTLELLTSGHDLRVSGDYQLQAIASLPLAIHWDQFYEGLVFWGLSTALFCCLWLRSRRIPKAFAAAGIAAGAWSAVWGFGHVINPVLANSLGALASNLPLVLFEVALSVTLLARPARPAA